MGINNFVPNRTYTYFYVCCAYESLQKAHKFPVKPVYVCGALMHITYTTCIRIKRVRNKRTYECRECAALRSGFASGSASLKLHFSSYVCIFSFLAYSVFLSFFLFDDEISRQNKRVYSKPFGETKPVSKVHSHV